MLRVIASIFFSLSAPNPVQLVIPGPTECTVAYRYLYLPSFALTYSDLTQVGGGVRVVQHKNHPEVHEAHHHPHKHEAEPHGKEVGGLPIVIYTVPVPYRYLITHFR